MHTKLKWAPHTLCPLGKFQMKYSPQSSFNICTTLNEMMVFCPPVQCQIIESFIFIVRWSHCNQLCCSYWAIANQPLDTNSSTTQWSKQTNLRGNDLRTKSSSFDCVLLLSQRLRMCIIIFYIIKTSIHTKSEVKII